MVAFLLAFAVFIVVIGRWYLIPAMEAAMQATPGQKRQLSAYSLLLMAIVLLVVLCGLVLTFRISRYFFPRHASDRSQTKYVDAWAESAKRLEVEPEDDS